MGERTPGKRFAIDQIARRGLPASRPREPMTGAKRLRAVLAAASTLAAQPWALFAQEEGSNLWRVLSITLGLAALAGILAALVVIGTSVLLSRGIYHGRSRWKLIRVRGSTPAKRGRTSGRRAGEGFRSEAGSLVPFAERTRKADAGERKSPVAAPREGAPKQAPPKEAARKSTVPPAARTSPKVLPKKLPSAGAPPPKQTLPGLSPPKKEGRAPAGLPPEKVLGQEARAPSAKQVEQPVPSGLPPGKAVEPETRVAPAKPREPLQRPNPPTGEGVEPETRAERARAVEQPERPEQPTAKVLDQETQAARARDGGRAERPAQPVPSPRAPLRAAEDASSVRWERCQVEWWRGYVTSDFYALAVGPDGEPYVAGRSDRFRWWGSEPPPQRGGAAEAHARLLERLAQEGWEATQTRGAWYGTRLRRRTKPTLRELSGRTS